VFDAVLRAVGRRGAARVTLADVGAEVGLAPSTLAERFGSKRDLLLAASRASVGHATAAFERPHPSRRTALEALVAALLTLSRPVSTRAVLANHLSLLQLDLADDDFRAVAQAHAAELGVQVRALLVRAAEDGELAPGADPEELARAVRVAYNGALLLWAVEGRGRLPDALRRDLEAVLAPWRT
jgi:AcrR family transcriptional regulator